MGRILRSVPMTETRMSTSAAFGSGDDAPASPPPIWVPALLGVVTFFDSWDSIVVAFVAVSLISEWNLSPGEVGILISASYAGQLIGAVSSGALSEIFGRIRVFVWCGVLMSVLAGVSAFASNLTDLMVLRFVQGLGIGGAMPACITYLSEIAPDRSRGRYISLFQFVTTSGYALAGVAAIWIIPAFGWRWMIGLGAIPLLVLPLIYWFVPESPHWMARRNRRAAVKQDGAIDAANSRQEKQVACPDDRSTRFSVLFSSEYGQRTAALCALWFCSASTTFGLSTWLPSLYVSVYRLPEATALKYGAVGQGVYLLMPILVALVIDRLGRRKSSALAFLASLVATSLLALIPNIPSFALVALASIGLNAASAAILILWIYTTELYPTEVRGLATGVGSGTARLASMIAPAGIGALLTFGNVTLVFLALASLCALAIAICSFLLPETLGRKLDGNQMAALGKH